LVTASSKFCMQSVRVDFPEQVVCVKIENMNLLTEDIKIAVKSPNVSALIEELIQKFDLVQEKE
ncbi:23718_t:CDS:2, partial [Gigaspora rosea]